MKEALSSVVKQLHSYNKNVIKKISKNVYSILQIHKKK